MAVWGKRRGGGGNVTSSVTGSVPCVCETSPPRLRHAISGSRRQRKDATRTVDVELSRRRGGRWFRGWWPFEVDADAVSGGFRSSLRPR
jgi:hypothetical protein